MKHTIKKNGSYYLTLTVIAWVDVFTRENHRKVIVEALEYFIQHKGLNVYCYCVMSNHIHLIVNTSEPFQLPASQDLKSCVSNKSICNA